MKRVGSESSQIWCGALVFENHMVDFADSTDSPGECGVKVKGVGPKL